MLRMWDDGKEKVLFDIDVDVDVRSASEDTHFSVLVIFMFTCCTFCT